MDLITTQLLQGGGKAAPLPSSTAEPMTLDILKKHPAIPPLVSLVVGTILVYILAPPIAVVRRSDKTHGVSAYRAVAAGCVCGGATYAILRSRA